LRLIFPRLDLRRSKREPVGFNLAVANPDSISAIVSQNGNAYEEGLGTTPWAPLRAYWTQPSPAIRETIKERMSLDGVRWMQRYLRVRG
jgi:hypothetical protein